MSLLDIILSDNLPLDEIIDSVWSNTIDAYRQSLLEGLLFTYSSRAIIYHVLSSLSTAFLISRFQPPSCIYN